MANIEVDMPIQAHADDLGAVRSQPAHSASVLRGAVMPGLLRDELLAEIFGATSSRHPDAPCMIAGDHTLTYREVDAKATALARGLVREGARPGQVVGLWMPRGHELLIAQIAIAMTGAAWLPFDADAPIERIAVCLDDASALVLLTSPSQGPGVEGRVNCAVLTETDLIDPSNHSIVNPRALGATGDHAAYMIYTSGSTGTPKGIVITQRNICHYLRAANAVYGLQETDVVFQGASVAFDLSMEEIWVPYLVGAALFVASPAMMGEADRLPELMEAARVSVLDTVPTLLAMLPRDVASLRVIILGGEACPPAVAARWCRPGRTIFNSYGPTEATVVATVAEVRAGEPVTIGKPIPNYTCYVVDDALNLVEPGVEGELLIGGPGVARGYLRRDELTAEKFILNPFDPEASDRVLYRSGDAVALDHKGDILFRGRIDDQVKIRGFRVELTDLPGIAQATVVLRNDDGLDQLVAFVTGDGSELDARALRTSLRQKLPAYMVPARFEVLGELPRLPSGKANRNALKKLPLTAPADAGEEQEEPRTPIEAKLLEAARKVLPPQAIPFDADFFTDLGGHSLLAARFLALVREHHEIASLTLQDVYTARSLRQMGAMLEGRQATMAPPRDLSFTPPPFRRRFLCGLAQALSLPIVLAVMSAQWLGVFVSYMLLTDPSASALQETLSLLGVYACINVASVALAIAMKWILLGRTKPGRYPLWGSYYFRWWLTQRFLGLLHVKWFQGSPIMRLYLRALGARVGDDALIGEVEIGAPDLVSIGAGASLGSKIKFANARVEGGELIIGFIDIGADAYLGTSCVIEEDTLIAESGEIRDLTSLQSGSRVGPREIWDGSPARKVGMVDMASLPPQADAPPFHRALQTMLYTVMLLLVPPIGLLPIFPAFWVFDRVDEWLGVIDIERSLYLASIPILAWPTSFALVLITVALIAMVRWIILPRVTEGTYSVHSWFYMRKWLVALTTEVTLETLSSLFATVYMRAWYRLMGARIGKDAEISTNLSGRYDLVEIGDKCFIADEVVLGDEDVRRGYMHLERVKTEARVFVGNDAVVPPGSIIPTGALIGIKSRPPANAEMSPGDTWFGSPPMKLPVRQKFDAGGYWTYEPPRWKKFMRGVFEAVHISLPTMLFITFGTWAVEVIAPPLLAGDYFRLAWIFVAISVAISVAMTSIVIAIKWLTMGRYEPVVKPMWSFWAMRTEAVAVMYWGLAGRVLLEHLRGTPFLPWVLRLFGSRFGKGVWMDMTDITEFDCVSVGDFAALNALSALQTHLYEDRVMKVGRVHVEAGVTVGAGSTVLYDTHVGRFARLGPLTVIMKGEAIPANTEWIGAPAQPKQNAPAATGLSAAA